VLVRQQDAVGLCVVDSNVVQAVPPRAAASHLPHVIETLTGIEPRGETALSAAVDYIVERAQRRASIIVLSDLFDRDERVLKKLAQLRLRKHQVTLFHTLDRAELEFPFDDPTLFLSMEDDRQVEAQARDIKAGYLEQLGLWLAEVKRASAEHNLDYGLCATDRPLDEILIPFLARRERRAGVRQAGATR
jgi:uncharacterized protein (DUF58 family)